MNAKSVPDLSEEESLFQKRMEESLLHQRMTKAIIKIIHENGECLPQDLLALGFSREETVEQWRSAYAEAHAELQRQKKIA
jgi:hypothetical protein